MVPPFLYIFLSLYLTKQAGEEWCLDMGLYEKDSIEKKCLHNITKINPKVCNLI